MTFEALNAPARYLVDSPGRKNLIWFASTFPVIFFPTPEQVQQLKNCARLVFFRRTEASTEENCECIVADSSH